ncbi:MAG: DUF6259 domain-containing protein, partial [bacterium]
LETELSGPGYTLWDIIYPEIGPISLHGDAHSIEPWGWGVLRKDLMDRRDERTYPGAAQAMSFIAVSDGETGLYIGAHDRKGYPMKFIMGKRENEDAVSLGIRHDVEGMGQAKKYSIPYDVVTIPYLGDWYEAGRIYRQATLKTPWGNIPPLAKRNDIPKWMKETDLWYLGSCHDETTAEQALTFAKYFEVPTSAHIYTWHKIPFDDHYPEYFPAKPGFKDAVRKVQEAGIPVMPYINGRLWDPATDSWKAKNAGEACAINEDGEKYVEVYGSKVPLSPMCPYTKLWQETVVSLVDRLLNDVGVKAVYIDQISAAAAKRCFAENHGHPVGGGTYWIQGYRELLRQCLDHVPDGSALTTEENADPWNDLLHAWLMVNTQARGGEIVPLYPAVYAGRAISFGFQYIQGGDLPNRYPFRLKMAWAFLYGSQLGWVGSQVLNDEYAAEAEFLKNLCQVRHSARDALQFGDLLPPVVLENAGTVSWTEETNEKETQHTQPAVAATAWLTPDGKRKIAFTNVADDPKSVVATLNQRHLGESIGDAVTLLPIEGGSPIQLHQRSEGIWCANMILPARSACIMEIQTP